MRLALVVAVVVLAGCVTPRNAPSPGDSLASHEGCNIPGPDKTPIDCTPTESLVTAGPPPGWGCVDHLNQTSTDGFVDVSLWSSQEAMGVWLQAHADEDGHFVVDAGTTAWVTGERWGRPGSATDESVFVPLAAGSSPGRPWTVEVHFFSPMSAKGLDVHRWTLPMREIGGGPWHWVAFDDGYTFPIMVRSPFGKDWVVGDLRQQGSDYNVTLANTLVVGQERTSLAQGPPDAGTGCALPG